MERKAFTQCDLNINPGHRLTLTWVIFHSGDEGGVPLSTGCSLLCHPQRRQLHQHCPERLGRQRGLCLFLTLTGSN